MARLAPPGGRSPYSPKVRCHQPRRGLAASPLPAPTSAFAARLRSDEGSAVIGAPAGLVSGAAVGATAALGVRFATFGSGAAVSVGPLVSFADAAAGLRARGLRRCLGLSSSASTGASASAAGASASAAAGFLRRVRFGFAGASSASVVTSASAGVPALDWPASASPASSAAFRRRGLRFGLGCSSVAA